MKEIITIFLFWSLRGAVPEFGNDTITIKEMEFDCRRLSCNLDERCVYRKNWCRATPCPSMVFCSSEENPRMPSSCDYVRCSRGYRCNTRYAKDQRTGFYTNIYAYCIAEREFRHRPVSCGGFKCPREEFACMLREPKCRAYPCRILQACIPKKEVDRLHSQCGFMNCSSSDHCYLKRPGQCSDNICRHSAACLHSRGEPSVHESCRGMMCPEGQKCLPVFESCPYQPCNAQPTCPNSNNSSISISSANLDNLSSSSALPLPLLP